MLNQRELRIQTQEKVDWAGSGYFHACAIPDTIEVPGWLTPVSTPNHFQAQARPLYSGAQEKPEQMGVSTATFRTKKQNLFAALGTALCAEIRQSPSPSI